MQKIKLGHTFLFFFTEDPCLLEFQFSNRPINHYPDGQRKIRIFNKNHQLSPRAKRGIFLSVTNSFCMYKGPVGPTAPYGQDFKKFLYSGVQLNLSVVVLVWQVVSPEDGEYVTDQVTLSSIALLTFLNSFILSGHLWYVGCWPLHLYSPGHVTNCMQSYYNKVYIIYPSDSG